MNAPPLHVTKFAIRVDGLTEETPLYLANDPGAAPTDKKHRATFSYRSDAKAARNARAKEEASP